MQLLFTWVIDKIVLIKNLIYMKTDILISANILFTFVCLLFAFGLKSYSLFLIFVFIAFVGNLVTKLVINRLNK